MSSPTSNPFAVLPLTETGTAGAQGPPPGKSFAGDTRRLLGSTSGIKRTADGPADGPPPAKSFAPVRREVEFEGLGTSNPTVRYTRDPTLKHAPEFVKMPITELENPWTDGAMYNEQQYALRRRAFLDDKPLYEKAMKDIKKRRNRKRGLIALCVGVFLVILTAILLVLTKTGVIPDVLNIFGEEKKKKVATQAPEGRSRWPPIWNATDQYPNFCITPDGNVDKEIRCHDMDHVPNFATRVESIYIGLMTGNDWMDLPDGMFTNLPKLTTLHLSRNQLRSLQNNAFQGLALLKQLKLDGNYLTVLNGQVFAHLGNLRVLDVSNNAIRSVHGDAFKQTTNLERIKLNTNMITLIGPRLLIHSEALAEIDLRENPEELCESVSNIPVKIKEKRLPEACEIPVSNCEVRYCSGHGSCHIVDENAVCSCNDGYTGTFCENKINADPCYIQPCEKGFECISQESEKSGFICQCVENCEASTKAGDEKQKSTTRQDLTKMILLGVVISFAVLLVACIIYRNKNRRTTAASAAGRAE